ncbi:MAG: peptidoglycan editing factor PgeF [Chloroflexota bacterium]
MPFHQPNAVRYLTLDSFTLPALTHAIFTRHGGVSQQPWASLNVGLTVGDNPQNVATNRKISFETVGRDAQTLSDSWLVHGKGVFIYNEPRTNVQQEPPKADIILTDNPQVTLYMRYADCVPILLYDPVNKAVGLAHSGWKGTLAHVASAAVAAMQARYGSHPEELIAAIGPSIGPSRYEVGPEVAAAVKQVFGASSTQLLPKYGSSTHFDLWAANELVLSQTGVKNIEQANICTSTTQQDWFSHRAENGNTGRFSVLLGLND